MAKNNISLYDIAEFWNENTKDGHEPDMMKLNAMIDEGGYVNDCHEQWVICHSDKEEVLLMDDMTAMVFNREIIEKYRKSKPLKYNKQELIKRAKEATSVETYEYVGKNHRIHTDTVKYIGNSSFDSSEIDALPFDDNGEVDADVELMDREDYERTLLANCSTTWDDVYADGDKILVIVVK